MLKLNVYKVDTEDGIPVDEVELPSGTKIRHGDYLFLTWPDPMSALISCQVAEILPEGLVVWPLGSTSSRMAFSFEMLEGMIVSVRERPWSNYTPDPDRNDWMKTYHTGSAPAR